MNYLFPWTFLIDANISSKQKSLAIIFGKYFNRWLTNLTRMHTNFAIFTAMGSLIVVALYCSSANFVSATTTNCYTIGDRYICVHVFDVVKPPAIAVVNCDKDGKNCDVSWVDKQTVVTPDAKNAIKNSEIAKFGRDVVTGGNVGDNVLNPDKLPSQQSEVQK